MAYEIGNKLAEKWTEDNAKETFEEMRLLAVKHKDLVSIESVVLKAGLYQSGYYYLLKKFPVLESIKKDLEGILLARIGEGGMMGGFNPAMCIWKSKQLGEKDESKVINENHNLELELSPEDRLKRIEQIRKKLD